MNIEYPFHFNSQGCTAESPEGKHLRDLIEQVLFTSPGERVNRPSFGSGLKQLVFAPNSEALSALTQATVQSSLQQWLGDLIQVEAIAVQSEEATLQVTVEYTVRQTQQRQVAQFSKEV